MTGAGSMRYRGRVRLPMWRRALAAVAALLFVLLVAWVGGLAWFIQRSTLPPQPPAQADGIVALTGGAGRIEAALHLLAEGRGRVALLSGVGPGAELAGLAHRAGLDPAPLERLVTLGRTAITTHGNAAETAAWARRNDVHSLIVVTAGYHMKRALAEMADAMPGMTLYPVPVVPPAMQGPGGMRDAGMLRLMAEEYTKWLAASLGLSGLSGPGQVPATRGARASGARASAAS